MSGLQSCTKNIVVVIFLGLVCCITRPATAFDDIREGFILGGGLGFGLTSFTQTLRVGLAEETGYRENHLPFQTDFKIGGAPTPQLQLYWMSKVNWFQMENIFGDGVTVAHGLGGLGCTCFFQPQAPSGFITSGFGYSSWALPFQSDSTTWYGLGLVGGAGYEFSPHWSIEGNVMYGAPSIIEGGIRVTTNALSTRLIICYVAY